MNRYEVFIKVIDCKSFTKAAEELNFTQSAVSQMVHTLEKELSTTLVLRSRGGIELTPDGREYLPYIRSICNAHRELQVKNDEMRGLQGGMIQIGTFTSVSRNWLPERMYRFKEKYPDVQFNLRQGEYTTIGQWIKDGTVDFGFVNPLAVSGFKMIPLWRDEMKAVLPKNHPLSKKKKVSLEELSKEAYILLDEGALSVPLEAFQEKGIVPNIEYKVFDDYTIMAMVEQGLGVSILYNLVLQGTSQKIAVKTIDTPVERTIALAYKNKETLPIASRYFMDFIIEEWREL